MNSKVQKKAKKIKQLMLDGKSVYEISKQLKLSKQAIYWYVWNKIDPSGNLLAKWYQERKLKKLKKRSH